MSDLEGVMLSDYLLLQCISKGGVADVYRAHQTVEGNFEVAVKIFRPTYAQRASFRDYFMTEAEKVGQFNHPNILPFLEFGEGEGLLYTVTPYVENGTLEDLLRRVGGKFSAMQALPIMQQLCSAVQYAHDNDVIHGNIKPSNIFVATDGRMLLSDFGISRGFDDSQQSLTRVGWGSAEFAAPEQSLGVLRRTSDIYTLGVLLFRILTGQPPFTGQTPVEVLLKHVRQQAPPARSIELSISDPVDNVLRIAMQKRSDNRFATAKEFSEALAAAVRVAPVASPVAKSVSMLAPRLTLSQPQPVADPHTPLPENVTDTPAPSVVPEQLESTGIMPAVDKPAQPGPSVTRPLGDDSSSEITEVRKKSFLEEPDDVGSHSYWTMAPVEWSPLEKEKTSSQALGASEYLRSMPLVPEASSSPQVQQSASNNTTDADEKKAESLLKKILPIIVVVLLLLGLIAALLSSFLLPSGSTNNEKNSMSVTCFCVANLEVNLRGKTWQNLQG